MIVYENGDDDRNEILALKKDENFFVFLQLMVTLGKEDKK